MNTLNIKLYNLVKNDFRVADNKAEEFVEVLNEIVHSDVKESTMEYKSLWKEDFANLDGEFRKLDGEIKRLDAKIDFKISDLRSDLRSEIKESKVDTIKWMIGIFIALAMMILGLYIKK
jgi:hypothetical protein